MSKSIDRQRLIQERLSMPGRLQKAEQLQQVMRIWLVGRPDTIIGAYWPIKGEFDPLPALHRWKEDGELLDQPLRRRIALPVVNRQHKTLTFHVWYPGCPMEEDAYQIPKPKDTEVVMPTLLFVPCLGYGPGGYRLGYGGGYFDRTLGALAALAASAATITAAAPLVIATGYELCRIPSIDPQPHDMPMDWLVTERGLYRREAGRLTFQALP